VKTTTIQTADGTKACNWCGRPFCVLIDCPTQTYGEPPGSRGQWGHLCDHCFEWHGVETSVNTLVLIVPAPPAGGGETTNQGDEET
jgi:hypothetical protein